MLLKRAELESIVSGAVSLVFRRWKKPSVKSGGTLKTGRGVLSIERVTKVGRLQITGQDAAAAGYGSLDELLAKLDSKEGDIYRIEVGAMSADPRIALRCDAELSAAELAALQAKLDRFDAVSRAGPWVVKVLRAIDRHPKVAAAILAQRIGWEKEGLKINIRKLKNLGLTASHEVGYELSPRGAMVLKHLRSQVRMTQS